MCGLREEPGTATGAVQARSDEQPSDGTFSAVFNHGNPAVVDGVLSQSFATVAGTTYLLSFEAWGWAGPNRHLLEVSVIGTSRFVGGPVSLLGSNPAVYVTASLEFVADSASTLLRFADRTTVANSTNSDFSIDRVSVVAANGPVSPVPEPETCASIAAGLAALSVVARRRRGRSAG